MADLWDPRDPMVKGRALDRRIGDETGPEVGKIRDMSTLTGASDDLDRAIQMLIDSLSVLEKKLIPIRLMAPCPGPVDGECVPSASPVVDDLHGKAARVRVLVRFVEGLIEECRI